jgi:hypothetical protein
MTPTFSLVVNHAPWAIDRFETARSLLASSVGAASSTLLHCTDYRDGGPNAKDKPVLFTVNQWNWAAQQRVTHHVFMTDDLDLAPGFWSIVSAMVQTAPDDVIGLLSNHPNSPDLLKAGYHWYRTNSWVVGPCYVVPHAAMVDLADWAERRWPAETWDKLGWSDDSELNHWVSTRGRKQALHPMPTPIEHKRELSTWGHTGHGDDYSHERVSWLDSSQSSDGVSAVLLSMSETRYWLDKGGPQEAPMLGLP